MKKILLIVLVVIGFSAQAQVLNVPQITQEQDEWCWAGCSKCMLNYYGDSIEQCTIAEYAREVISWTSFGTKNCCIDGHDSCNTPNYDWGANGSIADILHHFKGISCTGFNGVLTESEITAQMAAKELFVEHWSWAAGGGHFVVGSGISGGTIYYMNPWPGEGLSMCSYAWMQTDGDHTWDETLSISNVPQLAVSELPALQTELIYPNPSTGLITIKGLGQGETNVTIYNGTGTEVYHTTTNSNGAATAIDLSSLPRGLYLVRMNGGTQSKYAKLVLQN